KFFFQNQKLLKKRSNLNQIRIQSPINYLIGLFYAILFLECHPEL
ncbi:MAG: hypothetical protein ACI9J3_003643, partial [Parvicellaceae bacterium]